MSTLQVSIRLNDGRAVTVNKETLPEDGSEGVFGPGWRLIHIVGTGKQYKFRCTDEMMNDLVFLKHEVQRFIDNIEQPGPSFIYKRMHDFVYRDEKIECRWNIHHTAPNDISIDVAGKTFGTFTANEFLLSSQLTVEAYVKSLIDNSVTDAEFEPEDLTTQFIRACQNEFGTNGEITTITVNTKTKEITVTAQIEHKLFL